MKKARRPSNKTAQDRRNLGELERLGPGGSEVLVLGVEAPGFEDLPHEKKILAYYLYRGAIAGNNMAYLQSHRHALEIKELLEAIYSHRQGIPAEILDPVHDYLKHIWIHHGNYHHYTHTKFVPTALTSAGLEKAARIASGSGARIPTAPGETLGTKLARLDSTIFDPEFEPVQTNQSDGVDIVATSAVNFWDPGVTQLDLDALPDRWKHKLNVRFAKRDGRIVPEEYKIGGTFGKDLETVSHFLKQALSYAESSNQRESLELLIEYYRKGDEEIFRKQCVAWLKSNTTIDYLNGFIEQYLDPRGIIGSYEGNVSFVAQSKLLARLAENASYFEARMPWPDGYKRSSTDCPIANVVNVLVETGDAGPVSPAAYNLPNYSDIRRDYGSKNVILLNIENTRSEEILEKVVNEFYLPEYRQNILRHLHTKIRPLEVYMHEIIGHGSGQPDPDLRGDPRSRLGRVYSALEECRSDLAALYHIADPKLVEIGAFRADERQAIIETAYVTYLQGWLARYDRVEDLTVREAHDRGSQMILMYLLENGGDPMKDFGLEMIETAGDYYVKINDVEKVRSALGELLGTLQIVKSTGDAERASALFDRFGTRVNADWRRNLAARKQELGIPKMKAFVFPHLVPVSRNGKIVDVNILYDEDLTTQQMRFSRLQYVTDDSAD